MSFWWLQSITVSQAPPAFFAGFMCIERRSQVNGWQRVPNGRLRCPSRQWNHCFCIYVKTGAGFKVGREWEQLIEPIYSPFCQYVFLMISSRQAGYASI